MIERSMPVSDAELSSLAASHDIISLGMRADEARRARHGTRTTFVRVAQLTAEVRQPVEVPATAGEIRIAGVPVSRSAAIERVQEVVAATTGIPVSAFS